MIRWLMIVCMDEEGDGLDTAIAPDPEPFVSAVGPVRWDGKTATFLEIPPSPMEFPVPGRRLINDRVYSIVAGDIDEPAPTERRKLRLPDSKAPAGLLLVQDGSFRGCYFAVGSAPCWLGQGAYAVSNSASKVVLHTGGSPLLITGQEHGAEQTILLRDGDIVVVGRRRYQFVALPAEVTP